MSSKARAQLISDAFSLCQAGYVNARIPLDLIEYMSKELDFLPWSTLVSNRISFFIDMLISSEFYGEFKSYAGNLVKPYYKKLGWIEDRVKDEWPDRFENYTVQNSI